MAARPVAENLFTWPRARHLLESSILSELRKNDPRVGYTQLYGAPGTAGVAILSR